MKIRVGRFIRTGNSIREAVFRNNIRQTDDTLFYITRSNSVKSSKCEEEGKEGFSLIFGANEIEDKAENRSGIPFHFFMEDAQVLPSQLRELAQWIEDNLA